MLDHDSAGIPPRILAPVDRTVNSSSVGGAFRGVAQYGWDPRTHRDDALRVKDSREEVGAAERPGSPEGFPHRRPEVAGHAPASNGAADPAHIAARAGS